MYLPALSEIAPEWECPSSRTNIQWCGIGEPRKLTEPFMAAPITIPGRDRQGEVP